jgi:hypothetical protein
MSRFLSSEYLKLLKDIRFWILLFFLLRLYGISYPPLETGHNWRQTIVNMTARNYHEEGIDLAHPRVDIAGELSGITGMEFPLYNAAIAVMMDLFGEAHWYGRLLNLIMASIGIWFFFRLIRAHVDERTAFLAAMIMLGSLWFSMSRKIIPDIFSCSLMFIGIERSLGFITGRLGKPWLLIGPALCTLAVLMKLSAGCWMVLLPLSYFLTGTDRSRWWTFQVVQGIFLISVLYWYGIWVPHLVETYGYFHFFMGKELAVGASELMADLPGLLSRFYQSPLGYAGFAMVLLGLYQLISKGRYAVLGYTASVFFLFFLFILKSGENFIVHNYYGIPMVPLLAFIAAIGLEFFSDTKLIYGLLAVILLEGILNQVRDFRIKDEQWVLLELEPLLDRYTERDDLIWINAHGSPTAMYFAHRKGWSESDEAIVSSEDLEAIKEKGCKALLYLKSDIPSTLYGEVISLYKDEHMTLYGFK